MINRIAALCALFLVPLASLAGGWEYKVRTDDFNGADVHSISLQSEPGSAPAILTIRCDAGKPAEIWLLMDEVITADGDGNANLLYSVDGEVVRGIIAGQWARSVQYQGAYTWMVKPVLRKIEGGKILRFRAQGVLETYEATFRNEGLAEALEKLRPHCRRL